MSRRFIELAVRARRLVTRTKAPSSHAPRGSRLTARRQLGDELTQFSFRLAFVIDLAYVALGAVGGAAVSRVATPIAQTPATGRLPSVCDDTLSYRLSQPDTGSVAPNAREGGRFLPAMVPPGTIR